MRPMTAYRYPARDGLSVPAYLTRPAGEGPAPTVVLIHGGPWARDGWEWDAEVQLLAAKGYAVFQPQFRGSTGFGRAYEQAGYRQWGESMQDDITDGVRQLIERGIADPARIAIFGASYGGYAAMWGLVKTPRLYRCGISFAGISDLDDFLRTSWTDDSTAATRRIRRRLVGDPSTAQAQLQAVSPIRHVDRIEVPLLLVHGTDDKRVLPSQSRQMVRAMEARGKPVVWLPLETGHGFDTPDSPARRQYFERVLRFLEDHMGPRPA
jgi:dipeptidyl aminopeptidase/acylaminoacyl peptidase